MYLNIALSKGRLKDISYQLFDEYGLESLDVKRKLILNNKELEINFYLVKPSDVATYVESGVADLGIVGKDVLMENDYSILELLNLDYGKCKFIVAAQKGYHLNKNKILKVATKYVNVATKYFESINQDIEIVKLNGSVEIAPCIGIADVILDIMETGNTLIENDLEVIEYLDDINACLVVNESNYRFKSERINGIIEKFERVRLND